MVSLLLTCLAAMAPMDAQRQAELLLKHGDVERARDVATQAVAQSPSAGLEVTLGLALFELLDTGGARAAFRSALELDPAQRLPPWANPRAAKLFENERGAVVAQRLIQQSAHEAAVRRRPHAGLILMAGGATVAAVGLVFGALSRSSSNAAAADVGATQARQDHNTAVARASVANGLFLTGGALGAVGLGLALWPTEQGAWLAVGGPW